MCSSCRCFCAFTLPKKTVSYRFCTAGGTGVGRESDGNCGDGLGVVLARVLTLVREVVLRIEERSDAVPELRDVRVLGGTDPAPRPLLA
jgi:hypothetical protein